MTKQIEQNNFVCVGKILKPQGIKGEVKIAPLIDIPAIFNGKHQLFIEKQPFQAKSGSFRQGFAYVTFAEIPDRNEAEKFRGKNVFCLRKDFDALSTDHFLIDDLVGTLLNDENGQFVGQIVGVTDYGFDDILIVKQDGLLYEVPFKKQIFGVKQGKAEKEIFAFRAEFDGAKVLQE